MSVVDGSVLVVTLGLLAVLLHPRVRAHRGWRATVTPLASIIGSGFLVVAPVLAAVAGRFAVLAMAAVVLLAWAVGAVIRHNIARVEPLLARPEEHAPLAALDRVSDVALAAAYFVSVAFYVRLLAAFALRGAGVESDLAADAVATVVLLFIGTIGFLRGLGALESLEEWSVGVKLAIIGALLAGLFGHALATGFAPGDAGGFREGPMATVRRLLGLLLVVQGFETSRYLGAEYSAPERVRSMRWAQGLSGAIYVAFVLLATPLFSVLGTRATGAPSETAVVDLSAAVSPLLPPLLVLAAAVSQFSAAVADTVGSGGLLEQTTRKRFPERTAYLAVTLTAVALLWTQNLFQLVALASRAFAFYYLIQTFEALWCVTHAPRRNASLFARGARTAALLFLAGVLLACVLFAEPIG